VFEAVTTKVLLNYTGTQSSPITNVSVRGVTIRDTAYTYLDPHGAPAGGDWGLQRSGAVTLAGVFVCVCAHVCVCECVCVCVCGVGGAWVVSVDSKRGSCVGDPTKHGFIHLLCAYLFPTSYVTTVSLQRRNRGCCDRLVSLHSRRWSGRLHLGVQPQPHRLQQHV
jgi:hypothetical protein